MLVMGEGDVLWVMGDVLYMTCAVCWNAAAHVVVSFRYFIH